MKILLIIIGLVGVSCNYQSKLVNLDLDKEYYEALGYDLSEPDRKFRLPFELTEVSGLTYFKNQQIACVQDEEGVVFIFDLDLEEIRSKIHFSPKGDYEGIVRAGDYIYAIKSNGKAYKIPLEGNSMPVKINTNLHASNNIEGLAYDSNRNQIVIVGKGNSKLNGKDLKGKAGFIYDLETGKLLNETRFLITRKNIKEISGIDIKNFGPSAIAQHPNTGEFYIISHSAKIIVVVSPGGNLKSAYKLNSQIFNQPEGICFSPEGTLYISNEGQGISATLLEFKPNKR